MKKITVYQTDPDGLYQYEAVAHEYPLQPGTYNVPYGARISPPPAAPAGQVAQAVGDTWRLVADHRNAQLYRTDTAEAYSCGAVVNVNGQAVRYPGWGDVPAWLTSEVPPAPGSVWVDGVWVAPNPAVQ